MARDPLEKEADMNTGTPDYEKKLSASLFLAVVPFIPDILDAFVNVVKQLTDGGYKGYVKHGQTEIGFERSVDHAKPDEPGADKGGADDDAGREITS